MSENKVILIHGAWHWAGCWKYVKQILEKNDYPVFTPNLTVNKDTTLEDHINQVVTIIDDNMLDHVILVGHSYSGAVMGGVLAKRPNSISHSIFLDAFIPETDRIPLEAYAPKWFVKGLDIFGRIHPLIRSFVTAEGYGIKNAEMGEWVTRNLRLHPLKTFLLPFQYSPQYDSDKCTYIACKEAVHMGGRFFKQPEKKYVSKNPLTKFKQMAETWNWNIIEFNSGHDVMLILPEEVAGLIMEVK